MLTAIPRGSEATRAATYLLTHCGSLKPGERVGIVFDYSTRDVAEVVAAQARALGADVTAVMTANDDMHGIEPSPEATSALLEANLAIGLTARSLAHTAARQRACAAGARYLSLPEYSIGLLVSDCLRVDYHVEGRAARTVADVFTSGSRVRVTTAAGTDVELDIDGRTGNCCPGYVSQPGELGSPPDIEANVSPVETFSHGHVVIDGSIPHPAIGLLQEPVGLDVEGGKIINIGGNRKTVAALNKLFDSADPAKTRVFAECGVGLNSKAVLSGIMLTDEGAAGTMHFGFGSNSTVGGLNAVSFHLDFVFRYPTLTVDGDVVLDAGVLIR